jgi:site-specific DNA-cytosine methylase
MKMLEIFAGTRSMADTFEKHGFEVFTIELDTVHPRIDLYEDILNVTSDMIFEKFGRPDVIWASPVCTSYSIAAISTHRTKEENGNLAPKTEYAAYSDRMTQHTINLIKELNPTYYFIENPRGGMRKMNFMKDLPRYTVTYCQYGDTRMKPTDIWTNHPDPQFKPMCKNGMPCHEAAPRGAKTGTQGLKGSIDRSKIPQELCDHIVNISQPVLVK